MTLQRIYRKLPLAWKTDNPAQSENDRRWLDLVVRNAAPFSDWWAKARIVQLAHPAPADLTGQPKKAQRQQNPKIEGLPTYGGLTETEIVDALQSCCNPFEHPEFAQTVNEAFVVKTLNAWKSYRFSDAISRNFDLYAHRKYSNVFLMLSTAPVSLNVDRVLPPDTLYRPLFNTDELAKTIHARGIKRLTLRTHGYSNDSASFFASFEQEADALHRADATTNAHAIDDDHLYIGYHWPSEKPLTSPGLWADYRRPEGILFKFLFVLSGFAGIVGTLLYVFLRLVGVPVLGQLMRLPGLNEAATWVNFSTTTALAVQWYWVIPTVFMMLLLAFWLLRVVVYQRDRYRAVHYGAPDLAEFFWRLDAALIKFRPQIGQPQSDRLRINLVGHSMGGLLLINVVRLLSERGSEDEGTLQPDSLLSNGTDPFCDLGQYLLLDNLILASPDIPLEFLREGRNNYVRSAMRRCRRIYLMSSDRDIILRYLSMIGNWFSEPSIQMAGLRLGNVYLKPLPDQADLYRPYIRVMLHSESAIQPTSSYDLFRKFNYLDCSEMQGDRGVGGVNSVPLKLNRLTALPIDLLNTCWFIFGAVLRINKLDVHGGYFQVNTLSFRVFSFLLTSNFLGDAEIKQRIQTMVQDSPIRFLPSQPWTMPKEIATADRPITTAP
ncbi:MAG TPA: alpha/beta hydrolase [Chroococcidiopsis sp.]